MQYIMISVFWVFC